MSQKPLFADRAEAGRVLAAELEPYRADAPVVLGLPRGGVPVAYEVARALDADLDVLVVRKLGAPIQPELGLGAVAEECAIYIDRELVSQLEVSDAELAQLVDTKTREVEDRVKRFRVGEPPLDVHGRTVIVVDDGVATGGTARAALRCLRSRGAARLILAVPVGAADTVRDLAKEADVIVCPHRERHLIAVGLWYRDFSTTTDEDVVELLDRWRREHGAAAKPQRAQSERVPARSESELRIPVADGERTFVTGDLTLPAAARGLVLFAHGSGSSRRSVRNRAVARTLVDSGLATLLFDLLTEDEERVDARTGNYRFDIDLLARRLATVTDWVLAQPKLSALPIGYFGASTGAAAALVAAAARPKAVFAVVSRGGRPDLAHDALPDVKAPTLLIVGSLDEDVLALNQIAHAALRCDKELAVVHGATHLFEEPGTLEQVARLAAFWFTRHAGAAALERTG